MYRHLEEPTVRAFLPRREWKWWDDRQRGKSLHDRAGCGTVASKLTGSANTEINVRRRKEESTSGEVSGRSDGDYSTVCTAITCPPR